MDDKELRGRQRKWEGREGAKMEKSEIKTRIEDGKWRETKRGKKRRRAKGKEEVEGKVNGTKEEQGDGKCEGKRRGK